jgi:hypothetical protein
VQSDETLGWKLSSIDEQGQSTEGHISALKAGDNSEHDDLVNLLREMEKNQAKNTTAESWLYRVSNVV